MKNLFRRLARVARAHDSVLSRAQLLKIGFADERISRMLAKRLWQRLHSGVYLLSAAKPRGASAREPPTMR